MTRPIRYPDLESYVYAVRNAILLADQTFEAMELGSGDDVNLTSYALSHARDEANQLLAAFLEAFETARAEKRAAA